ncbi:MAG TPA: STAS domain-containing protein [Candidatus Limnocylindrales bacterium]|nr:STAS domain-containing protein [Candidatus Limnocylindrales bacterium]
MALEVEQTAMGAQETADRCPHPKPFAPDFAGCPAYQAVAFTAADSMDRRLGTWLTCRHLSSGQAEAQPGRFYPKCSLGGTAERQRWLARVRPERLEVVRVLQEEFDRFSEGHRERLSAARKEAQAAPADWERRQELDRLLAEHGKAVAGFLLAREERFEDVGLPIGPLHDLIAEASSAGSRTRRASSGRLDEDSLLAFSAESQSFLGRALPAPRREESGPELESTIYSDATLEIARTTNPRGLALRGELDASNADAVFEVIQREAARDGELAVDLSGVLFCDVAGLRAIVRASERLEPGQRLHLRQLPAHLEKTMQIVGWRSTASLQVTSREPPR